MNSFMLVRHGCIVAEGWWAPYNADSPHSLYSLSKSFTSTAVGLATSEGKLSLDDEVLKFFPDDAPAQPSANLKSMRVSDLLRMSCGQQTEPARKPDEVWTKTFLAHEVPFKPGTHFLYNTSGTYMLSAIVQKATGMTALDYLKPRLFEPLGIEHPTWETSPQGISAGGFGLSIRTEDIARFGQLYLQKGKWDGKQLVPESWVAAATSRQTSNGSSPTSDWDQGYGYQFWRCRHGAYRGDGAFGQYCIVLPEQDAVVAITSGVKDMQAVLNVVWDKLLPALNPSPLPADSDAAAKLAQTLKGLTIKPQEGSASPSKVALGKKFVFPTNDRKLESIALEPSLPAASPSPSTGAGQPAVSLSNGGEGGAEQKDNGFTLIARVAGIDKKIPCGHDTWQKTQAAWGRLKRQPLAASGAWTAPDTYTAKLCFYETPFIITLRLQFTDNELHLTSESNVGFDRTKDTTLVGRAE